MNPTPGKSSPGSARTALAVGTIEAPSDLANQLLGVAREDVHRDRARGSVAQSQHQATRAGDGSGLHVVDICPASTGRTDSADRAHPVADILQREHLDPAQPSAETEDEDHGEYDDR